MNIAVKMADGADDTIEGLAVPYGGVHGGRDVEGEFFTKSTDLALTWFGPGERPMLYHHGLDADAGMSVVGRVGDYKATDTGLWAQAQLDRSSEYFDAIKKLVAAGKLYFSSGSMSHLAKRKKSGEITTWPWVELSLTPTPANLLAEVDFATAEKHFEAAGLKMAPELAPEEPDEDEDDEATKASLTAAARAKLRDSDFAYIDSDGTRHLPINDEAHVRAALSRFNQTQFESTAAKAKARRRIAAAAKRLGVDSGGKSVTADYLVELTESLRDAKEPAEALKISQELLGAVRQAVAQVTTKDIPDGPTLMADMDGGPYPEGSYEDLADDIAQALREQSGTYAYVRATFPGYALACVAGETDDANDDPWATTEYTHYRVAYTVDGQGEPVLGEMQEVELAMIPSTGKSADLPMLQTDEAPLAIQSARLSDYAALLMERTQGVQERRQLEGRTLSTANRDRLATTADALEGAVKAMRALLATTEPEPVKTDSVDRIAHLNREIEGLQLWASVAL